MNIFDRLHLDSNKALLGKARKLLTKTPPQRVLDKFPELAHAEFRKNLSDNDAMVTLELAKPLLKGKLPTVLHWCDDWELFARNLELLPSISIDTMSTISNTQETKLPKDLYNLADLQRENIKTVLAGNWDSYLAKAKKLLRKAPPQRVLDKIPELENAEFRKNLSDNDAVVAFSLAMAIMKKKNRGVAKLWWCTDTKLGNRAYELWHKKNDDEIDNAFDQAINDPTSVVENNTSVATSVAESNTSFTSLKSVAENASSNTSATSVTSVDTSDDPKGNSDVLQPTKIKKV